ncbi:MAG: DUF6538 domain-containing protein [Burkholderiales bacterium]
MAGDYIQRSRHGTVFYFRRRVPLDLRSRLQRLHIYISLRTELHSVAKCRARAMAAATDRLFSELRYVHGDGKDTEPRTYFDLFLDFDEKGRPRVKLSYLKPGDEVAAGEVARRVLGVANEANPSTNLAFDVC